MTDRIDVSDIAPEFRDMLEAEAKAKGMTLERYINLTIEERVQLAYDNGQAFAAIGVAAKDHEGKPVYSQEAQRRDN